MSVSGNEITINSSESLLTGNAQYEIYSMNGQLMQAATLQAIHESDYTTIVTQEELPNGIYVITLSTPEGRVTEKFLVAR
jgi:hypothetical protein